jgi:hypothetical protein
MSFLSLFSCYCSLLIECGIMGLGCRNRHSYNVVLRSMRDAIQLTKLSLAEEGEIVASLDFIPLLLNPLSLDGLNDNHQAIHSDNVSGILRRPIVE